MGGVNYDLSDAAQREIERMKRRMTLLNERRQIEVDAAWRGGIAAGRRSAWWWPVAFFVVGLAFGLIIG